MTQPVSMEEHLDRIRRVQSVPCPKCGAGKGEPCRSPKGDPTEPHHAARYAALYRREASRA